MKAKVSSILVLFTLGSWMIGVQRLAGQDRGRARRFQYPRSVWLSKRPASRPLHFGAAKFPVSANSDAIRSKCPPEAVGAVCGHVRVPLDRAHPGGAKLRIYFELYAHTGPGEAVSAILGDPGGGGGDSTTVDNRGIFLFWFGPNLDVHDLLLIDGRGRGLSEAIDCAELQHGGASLVKAIADCAAQLGKSASRYGAGDIAQDIEAVRAALGYEKVDYYGGSYGGVPVTAYATRFGEHLRSVILDSAAGAPSLKPFAWDAYRAAAQGPVLAADCRHSPTCNADHADPLAEFSALVASIRAHPVEGDTHDAFGNPVHVRVDENALLNFVSGNQGTPFFGTAVGLGEVLAAAVALRNGDPAPLLRLDAEGSYNLALGDSGDPTFFSLGAAFATCVDVAASWDWAADVEMRKKQYAQAIRALSPNFFAPFSRAIANRNISSFVKPCMWWEEPTPSSPVEPPQATYPNVPTLVLSGELDDSVPVAATQAMAALFPASVSVTFAGIEHKPMTWSDCAAGLAAEFVESLHVADTSCAQHFPVTWPAVGRFPVHAADARPAQIDPGGDNHANESERKVATVALAAATDALQRSRIGTGDNVCLRGGTFHTDYADSWTVTLTDCAFAQDVIVNGTLTWAVNTDASISADLTVHGSGTGGGTIRAEGTWLFVTEPVGNIKITGTLGGKTLALLVPEA